VRDGGRAVDAFKANSCSRKEGLGLRANSVRATPARSRLLGPSIAIAISLTLAAPASATTETFGHTGAAQTFTVPAEVTKVSVDAFGGAGGQDFFGASPGGRGGRATAMIAVSPGEELEVNVGGAGSAGGFNGGGGVSGCGGGGGGGAGGGASDVRRDADADTDHELAERVVVAGGGGGGGGGGYAGVGGGTGGGTTGGDGGLNGDSSETTAPGRGGTQGAGGAAGTSAGGTFDGQPGQLGVGADATTCGSAGGGGLYGGGSAPIGGFSAGGGGGSGFTASGSGMTNGVREGDGQVILTYTVSPTPALTTNASAGVTVGGSVSDTATLAGGSTPGGNITFRLYGPNDANCSSPAVFTDTKTVSGNGSYQSANFTPAQPGTYRWVAAYSGDIDNNAVAGGCNDANQSIAVSALPQPDPPTPDPDLDPLPPVPELRVTGLDRDRDAGTATLTVAANLAGNLSVAKTNKVKVFGPVRLTEPGSAELEIVPRNRAAEKLARTGRLTVNPRILFVTDAVDIGIRHQFDLRQD